VSGMCPRESKEKFEKSVAEEGKEEERLKI